MLLTTLRKNLCTNQQSRNGDRKPTNNEFETNEEQENAV